MKEQIWLTNVKYEALLDFMGIIHMCIVFKTIGMNAENKSAKQVIHKWSLMIKNKYGCQMYST